MGNFLSDGYQSPVSDSYPAARDIAPLPWHISLAYAVYYILLGTQPSYHTGCDLSQEAGGGLGSPVYAAANGKVTYAKDVTSSSWRNLLVVQHFEADGSIVCSRYGHLLAFAPNIRPGVNVVRGQLVGWVGNASGLFYPHLHFDLARGLLLVTTPTHWPAGNYRSVLDNYIDPDVWIRNEVPMADTSDDQIIEHAQQIIDISNARKQGDGGDGTPVPGTIKVVVNGDKTRIRHAPSTSAPIDFVLNTGTELTVTDPHITADSHDWWQIVSPITGYIAKDVVSPKV